MLKIWNNVSCHLVPKVNAKGQKMFFLVNTFPLVLLNVAISNLQSVISNSTPLKKNMKRAQNRRCTSSI